jgi:hypothetical protein
MKNKLNLYFYRNTNKNNGTENLKRYFLKKNMGVYMKNFTFPKLNA